MRTKHYLVTHATELLHTALRGQRLYRLASAERRKCFATYMRDGGYEKPLYAINVKTKEPAQ